MSTKSEVQANERRVAANLIYEAKLKEFEAACWLGHNSNIAEAAAAVHSALDGMLDATLSQVKAFQVGQRQS